MEKNNEYPYEIDSDSVKKALAASILCLNKKRKLQAEQLNLPQPKHKCCSPSFALEYDLPSDLKLEAEEFCPHTCNGQTDGSNSEPESAKGSNSISGYADSLMSVSNESKATMEYPKTCSCDLPCISSVNWCGNCFKTIVYSLESRSVTKSSDKKEKSGYNIEVDSSVRPEFKLDTAMNYEEHLLELGEHADYLEYGENVEQSAERELEDIIYCNEANLNNYVLSSGRWNVNQETQSSTNKLTIDKEFEQYFSTLML